MEDASLLQQCLQAHRAETSSFWDLIDDGGEVAEQFAALVRQDSGDASWLDFCLFVAEFDEAGGLVLAGKVAEAVFDDVADG